MAPSSKSGKHENKQKQRKQESHIVKLLNNSRLSGHLSDRWFRKRRPRVRVPLKTIVSEATLRAQHIFLGFTKCGRYVLSYTRDYGEADDTYIYHLYWWEFNLHKSLKQVHRIRLFADHQIYSDLHLAVCEWHNAQSKIVIFGYSLYSSSSASGEVLLNMLMSDEDSTDVYITIISMPPDTPTPTPCLTCQPSTSSAAAATATATATPKGECLEHGFVLNAHYQVVHPIPTFQPALQLKKEKVILLNTSYSLVACAISLCQGGKAGEKDQVLYRSRAKPPSPSSTSSALNSRLASSSSSSSSSSTSHGSTERAQQQGQQQRQTTPVPVSPSQSQAAMRAREFAADIFRRAQAGSGSGVGGSQQSPTKPLRKDGNSDQVKDKTIEDLKEEEEVEEEERTVADGVGLNGGRNRDVRVKLFSSGLEEEEEEEEDVHLGPLSSSIKQQSCVGGGGGGKREQRQQHQDSTTTEPPSSPQRSTWQQQPEPEPGYVNYTRLKYWLPQQGPSHRGGRGDDDGEDHDDKFQLPFTVTDLKGNKLQLINGACSGQCVCVEQLTLDFEYVINEVIRNDAEWSSRFCSFSDYDVVILEMCPETNIVIINIGLMLAAFPPAEDKSSRPESFHTSLQVSWDLNTGECSTLGVGELKEMKGQSSGSVWGGYRKSCLDTVMRCLVPENSSRHINRMTNEALHKGLSLRILADRDRGTWITH
ncbi:DDB1- and CUL4-associated factor 15 isoform X2 [Engraulis encrasicolus]|uniref:DDB1- and CUL4-associated factor 15 isoform X2 n=1 Tax=Engraulis encrasicolus TaxID=184585 RepID=UPI002FCE85A4